MTSGRREAIEAAARPWTTPRSITRAGDEEMTEQVMTEQVEQARQRAIGRLEEKIEEDRVRFSRPHWQGAPNNPGNWVQSAYYTAIGLLKERDPLPGEDGEAYLRRVAAEVRERREAGPDADDEGWYASGIDAACGAILREGERALSDRPAMTRACLPMARRRATAISS
jgi:hypothetical protein